MACKPHGAGQLVFIDVSGLWSMKLLFLNVTFLGTKHLKRLKERNLTGILFGVSVRNEDSVFCKLTILRCCNSSWAPDIPILMRLFLTLVRIGMKLTNATEVVVGGAEPQISVPGGGEMRVCSGTVRGQKFSILEKRRNFSLFLGLLWRAYRTLPRWMGMKDIMFSVQQLFQIFNRPSDTNIGLLESVCDMLLSIQFY